MVDLTQLRRLMLAIVFVLTMVGREAAQPQTLQVIHNFTGGRDGANPYAGLTMDTRGNLYGTAYSGGAGYGSVFELKRAGSGWVFNPLYSFNGGSGDGANPEARVVFGPDGLLYGATSNGGDLFGTVFNLRPSPTACVSALCPDTETVLYAFTGFPENGENPQYGDLIFDQAGDIYGTTLNGGINDCGMVYELTPSGSGRAFTLVYSFGGVMELPPPDTCRPPDGAVLYSGLIFDGAGHLYGTTLQGGTSGYGTVFQLSYVAGTGWTESLLHIFDNTNGSYPYAGLIFDQSGDLYGATSHTSFGGGAVFELTPSNGSWTYSLLYHFTGGPECGPRANLVMDGASNLYGTTYCDGTNGYGNVFELSPSNGGWTYTDLHDFTGGSDGGNPISNVIFDVSGNLYGTASSGGALGYGVVWKVTP